jgi:glycerol-3-phosphate dehydrogenase
MAQQEPTAFDLAVIGGGINGAGIARDAAGRGLKVLLVEQNDLASGTSSASTKLIHGGLRYLERGALRLVREALAEREVLLRMAPHLVRPSRFALPLPPEQGSALRLRLRLGLFIYDHLGGRRILPGTRTLDLTHHPVGVPLKRRYRTAFEYSDCRVDDARLVVLNALDAVERGAVIRTRTRCARAERDDIWRLILMSRGTREAVTARALVNAAGPWVGEVAENVLRTTQVARARLVKGSHIVVRRLFDHDAAYLFQAGDARVVFALPFERDFTLIGTTDEDFSGDPAGAAPTHAEIDYLCKAVNAYFRSLTGPADVVWSFAGVRSLYDDGSARATDTTRDYHLVCEEGFRLAPLLTVYGGKITTYRRLAEAALSRLASYFALRPAWTATVPLPGGDFAYDAAEAKVAQARRAWPFLSEDYARRLVRAYGTRIDRVLGNAKSLADLGRCFGADLTEAELRYLIAQEWAREADDVLWRRSKLGLRLDARQRAAVADFMTGAINVQF